MSYIARAVAWSKNELLIQVQYVWFSPSLYLLSLCSIFFLSVILLLPPAWVVNLSLYIVLDCQGILLGSLNQKRRNKDCTSALGLSRVLQLLFLGRDFKSSCSLLTLWEVAGWINYLTCTFSVGRILKSPIIAQMMLLASAKESYNWV